MQKNRVRAKNIHLWRMRSAASFFSSYFSIFPTLFSLSCLHMSISLVFHPTFKSIFFSATYSSNCIHHLLLHLNLNLFIFPPHFSLPLLLLNLRLHLFVSQSFSYVLISISISLHGTSIFLQLFALAPTPPSSPTFLQIHYLSFLWPLCHFLSFLPLIFHIYPTLPSPFTFSQHPISLPFSLTISSPPFSC